MPPTALLLLSTDTPTSPTNRPRAPHLKTLKSAPTMCKDVAVGINGRNSPGFSSGKVGAGQTSLKNHHGSTRMKRSAVSSGVGGVEFKRVKEMGKEGLEGGVTSEEHLRGLFGRREVDTFVAGTGPAALFLSFLFHGNVPCYDTSVHGPHKDTILHNLLVSHIEKAGGDTSLLPVFRSSDAFTAHFASKHYTRQALPINVLYDILARPGADTGDVGKGRIRWERRTDCIIDHVCVGKEIGGHWAAGRSGKALSYAEMLGLPGYTFEESMGADPFGRPERKKVKRYLENYPMRTGVKDSVFSGVEIVDISRFSNPENPEFKFRITLRETSSPATGSEKKSHTILAKTLILATGVSALPLPPPPSLPFTSPSSSTSNSQGAPALVIGTGFSAADEILHHLSHNHPVMHIYKWRTANSQPLKSCHPAAYPEYARVWRLMNGKRKEEGYIGFPDGGLSRDEGGGWTMEWTTLEGGEKKRKCLEGVGEVKFLCGRGNDMAFLSPQLREELGLLSSGKESSNEQKEEEGKAEEVLLVRQKSLRARCEESKNLEVARDVFVVGSLTGDSLIKFLGGACLGVGAEVLGRRKREEEGPGRREDGRRLGCGIA